MKKAFVTGGSGFVGRNLIKELRVTDVEVRALARSDKAEAEVRDAGAESVRGDLDDVAAMQAGMDGCDVVFHAAAVVELLGDPDFFHRVNVQGTQNVIDAAKAAGVSRFVLVSTEALLSGGPTFVDIDETAPYPANPVGLYPKTKGEAERLVLAANCDAMATVAVRPPSIWGAGDTSVLPQIVAAVKGGQWMWFGGGHYLHTSTHVRNVIEGLILAAEKGRGGEVYFVTDGEEMDYREFWTALIKTQGVDPGDKSIPLWLATIVGWTGEALWKVLPLKGVPPLPRTLLYVAGRPMVISDAKARKELGYQGKVTFEEGLAEMTQ